ncbi:MAG: hypothetical protein AAF404_07440 [Pseudomonadota bacterium]
MSSSTARKKSDLQALKLGIYGHFPDDAMVNWIVHRAGVLDLSGAVDSQSSSLIEVVVIGELVLLDAFEVACSLGAINAQVHSITRQPLASPDPCYRHRRQFIRY